MSETVGADERGLTEGIALAVLVGMVVFTTVAVGMYVLVVESDAEQEPANFTFQHFSGDGSLLITHAGGEPLPAGDVLIEGPDNTLTWAESAGISEDTEVSEGDVTQLSQQSSYGAIITIGDTITVYHVDDDQRIQLSRWEGG
jgi:hypothetical protein